MAKSINYGQLMHKALRGLIAEVLTQVARDGLPGEHHFFITFDTTHPGVDMAASLHERYPGEMTVVLQNQFDDLAVMKDRFSVTLSFGNIPHPIVIPFTAIKTFADPSVNFGLKFDGHEGAADRGLDAPTEPLPPKAPPPVKPAGDGEVVSLDKFRKH